MTTENDITEQLVEQLASEAYEQQRARNLEKYHGREAVLGALNLLLPALQSQGWLSSEQTKPLKSRLEQAEADLANWRTTAISRGERLEMAEQRAEQAVAGYEAATLPEVTSVEELHRLPSGSIVRAAGGSAWKKFGSGWGAWFKAGDSLDYEASLVVLPARVLYRPEVEDV